MTLSGATTKTKEVDLCLHVFNHVITLYRGNRKQELRDIGLKPLQAEFISQLPWLELQKLARYFWFFATVRCDTKLLNQLVNTAVASARWIGQCSELIRRGCAAGPDDALLRHELRGCTPKLATCTAGSAAGAPGCCRTICSTCFTRNSCVGIRVTGRASIRCASRGFSWRSTKASSERFR